MCPHQWAHDKHINKFDAAGKVEGDDAADPVSGTKQKGDPAAGETRWSQASADGLQRAVPQQPSELDESASSQEASNASMESVGRLAYHDALTSVDTDRGPVLDAVYNGPVTGGHRAGGEEEVRVERDPSKSTSSKDR